MRVRVTREISALLGLALVACGAGSPTEPARTTRFARISHSAPDTVSRGQEIEFDVTVEPLEGVGQWDGVGLTVSLPGVFDRESARVVQTNSDSVDKTPAALHGGGFDLIFRRSDFRLGRTLTVRIEVMVRNDAARGRADGSIDAVAENLPAAGDYLELGLLPLRFDVR